MKDELITIKTAKLAKKKGFREEVIYYYGFQRRETISCAIGRVSCNWSDYGYPYWVSAPSQTFLHRWLREIYGFYVDVKQTSEKNIWAYDISGWDRDYENESTFPSYEEALEHGLQEALNLIKL